MWQAPPVAADPTLLGILGGALAGATSGFSTGVWVLGARRRANARRIARGLPALKHVRRLALVVPGALAGALVGGLLLPPLGWRVAVVAAAVTPALLFGGAVGVARLALRRRRRNYDEPHR
ncbi:MAG: hypothetical protein CMN30_29505 [Sandaracinus sp.]|nr:hypothetical protein [Sandaracinus sp.]